jgi:hypothetical protein
MARHHHAVQRVGLDLAESEKNPGLQTGKRRRKEQGAPRGNAGFPHQHNVVDPDAVFHGGKWRRIPDRFFLDDLDHGQPASNKKRTLRCAFFIAGVFEEFRLTNAPVEQVRVALYGNSSGSDVRLSVGMHAAYV